MSLTGIGVGECLVTSMSSLPSRVISLLSPLGMSEKTENSAELLNKRSCTRCNQRKVRCDKRSPCNACIKAEVQCHYPGPKRARRTLNRPPISELVARLKYLEDEVAQLRSNSGSSHSSDLNHSEENNATKPELLVRKEGKSRYIGDEASIALGEQVRLWFSRRCHANTDRHADIRAS